MRAIHENVYKMDEKTKKIATVGFDFAYQDDLREISKSLGITQGQFLESAIRFFRKTGIDPNSHLDDTRSQIKELRTTFISFQRNHEKNLKDELDKLHHNQEIMMKLMVQFYEMLNDSIEKSAQTNEQLGIAWSQFSQLIK